jgi:hypothetical protein
MKPPKTKRNPPRSRRKPPSDAEVQFVVATLASFGARAEVVPTDGDPPESWEVWRVARAKEVAVPRRVLDHAAATLLALLDCVPPERGPPGARADPAVAVAMRWHELIGHPKAVAARLTANSEAWRLEREAADRRVEKRMAHRRERAAVQEDIPDGIRGEVEAWRTQIEERSFQAEERENAYTHFGKPETLAAVEDRARVLMRKMHPSRRRRPPTKLKK